MTLYEEIVSSVMREAGGAVYGWREKAKEGKLTGAKQIYGTLLMKLTDTKNNIPAEELNSVIRNTLYGVVSGYPKFTPGKTTTAQLLNSLSTNTLCAKPSTAAISAFEQACAERGWLASTERGEMTASSKENSAEAIQCLNSLEGDTNMSSIMTGLFNALNNNDKKIFVNPQDGKSSINEAAGGLVDSYKSLSPAAKSDNMILRIAKNPFYTSDLKKALETGYLNELEYTVLVYLSEDKKNEYYNNFVKVLTAKGMKLPAMYDIQDSSQEEQNANEMSATEGEANKDTSPLWSKIYTGYGAFDNDGNASNLIDPRRTNIRISNNGLQLTILDVKAYNQLALVQKVNLNSDIEETSMINTHLLHYEETSRPRVLHPEIIKVDTFSGSKTDEEKYKWLARASFYDYASPENWGVDIADWDITTDERGKLIVNGNIADIHVDHKRGFHDIRLLPSEIQLLPALDNVSKAAVIYYYVVRVSYNDQELTDELSNLCGGKIRGKIYFQILVDENGYPYVGVIYNNEAYKCKSIRCTTSISNSKENKISSIKSLSGRMVPMASGGVTLYAIPVQSSGKDKQIIPSIEQLVSRSTWRGQEPNRPIKREYIESVINLLSMPTSSSLGVDTKVARVDAPYQWVTNNNQNLELIDFTPRIDRNQIPVTPVNGEPLQNGTLFEASEFGTSLDTDIFKGNKQTYAKNIIQNTTGRVENIDGVIKDVTDTYQAARKDNGGALPSVYRFSSDLQFNNNYIFYIGEMKGMSEDQLTEDESWRPANFITNDGEICIGLPGGVECSNYGRIKVKGKLWDAGKAMITAYPSIKMSGHPYVKIGNTAGDIKRFIEEDGSFNLSAIQEAFPQKRHTGSVDVHKLVCATWNMQKLAQYDDNVKFGKVIVHHIDSNPHHFTPNNLTFVSNESNAAFDRYLENPPYGIGLFYVGFDFMETAVMAWPENEYPEGSSLKALVGNSIEIIDELPSLDDAGNLFSGIDLGAGDKTGLDLPGKLIPRRVIFSDYEKTGLDGKTISPVKLKDKILYYEVQSSLYNQNIPSGYYLVDAPINMENPAETCFGSDFSRKSEKEKANIVSNADADTKDEYFELGKDVQKNRSRFNSDDEMKTDRKKRGLYRDKYTDAMNQSYKDTAATLQENVLSLMDRMGMRLDD